jgi:hypothetical protein
MRHAEHFQMDVIAVQTECGSAMCIAGHTLELAGYKRKLRPDDEKSYVLDFDFIAPSGRKVKSPLAAAGRELGIPYRNMSNNKAYKLFLDWELTTPKEAADRIQELIDGERS